MKTLGPEFWLLGASTEPPCLTAHFNKTPLLITEVKGRTAPQPIIQAGGPLLRSAAPSASEKQDEDPWLVQDPWSQYRTNRDTARRRGQGAPPRCPSQLTIGSPSVYILLKRAWQSLSKAFRTSGMVNKRLPRSVCRTVSRLPRM